MCLRIVYIVHNVDNHTQYRKFFVQKREAFSITKMSIHDELIARIMGVHSINVHVVDIYLSSKILLFAKVQFDVFKYILYRLFCIPLTYTDALCEPKLEVVK